MDLLLDIAKLTSTCRPRVSRTPTGSSPIKVWDEEEEAGIFLRDEGGAGEDVVMKTPARYRKLLYEGAQVLWLHCTHILLFSFVLHV